MPTSNIFGVDLGIYGEMQRISNAYSDAIAKIADLKERIEELEDELQEALNND